MREGLFFYFMKVGAGNAFMGFAEQLGALEDRQGLFVGYHGREIPAVTDDGKFQGPLDDKELQTIALASREAIRSRSIACVFTDSHLTFWEITGYLGAMPPSEAARFAEIPSEALNRALDYDKDWKGAKSETPHGQIDVPAFLKGYHWLPARLLCPPIPRYKLLAPVDSLRVHRYLNSGTFRSAHSIKGNGLMDHIDWLEKIERLEHGAICSRTKETSYAKLVRQYLMGVIWNDSRVNLDDRQIAELAARWINPAQLETVGALLVLDLGFTLEVGLGKGQDVVDIKASLGHLSGKDKHPAIKAVLDRLEGVLQVSMTRSFRERITEHGILWVQCKAQDLDGGASEGGSHSLAGPNPDLVLTLLPGASHNPAKGRLYLSHLMDCVASHPDSFPHLSNWQRFYMVQIREGICGSRGHS